jgi:hypothetical protein
MPLMVSLRAERSGVEKSGALHELHTQQIALDTSITRSLP